MCASGASYYIVVLVYISISSVGEVSPNLINVLVYFFEGFPIKWVNVNLSCQHIFSHLHSILLIGGFPF